MEEKAFMEEKGAKLGFTQQEGFQEEEKGRRALVAEGMA